MELQARQTINKRDGCPKFIFSATHYMKQPCLTVENKSLQGMVWRKVPNFLDLIIGVIGFLEERTENHEVQ